MSVAESRKLPSFLFTAMEIPTPRSGKLKHGKLAVVAILSLLIFSQECQAMRAEQRPGVQASIPPRKLLQGDPGMGEAPPLENAVPQQIIVDASGRGDYTSVQAAVNAVPDGNPQHLVIRIFAGNYV